MHFYKISKPAFFTNMICSYGIVFRNDENKTDAFISYKNLSIYIVKVIVRVVKI